MRFAAAMLLAICALAASGQKNIWEGVSAEYDPPKLDTANCCTVPAIGALSSVWLAFDCALISSCSRWSRFCSTAASFCD